MILVASGADAQATRKRDGEGDCRFWRTTFIGSDAGELGVSAARSEVPQESATPYPVAYLIELDPRSDLGVHFHRANQFQVFVSGAGRVGRRELEPQRVTVHYAGAFSAYGPVCPGAQGLHFMTLRDAWDPGARMLPEHADELRLARAARREMIAEPFAVCGPSTLRTLPGAACSTLFAAPDDALGAWSWTLPPDAAFTLPADRPNAGQFLVVLAGSLRRPAADDLAPLSCLFFDGDEAPPTGRAGAAGLQLLVLRFPLRPVSASARTTAAAAARATAGRD